MGLMIGIAGGIGSGKSLVSRILRLWGHTVFDCDFKAKILMDRNNRIKEAICREISSDVTDGETPIDRKLLSSIVFNDEYYRRRLNNIVHEAVREEIELVRKKLPEDRPLFVESAILAESGIADRCRFIIVVEAPEEVKIRRVMERNSCDKDEVKARIEAQKGERTLLEKYRDRSIIIENKVGIHLMEKLREILQIISVDKL